MPRTTTNLKIPQDSAALETVSLNFNYDPERLGESGVDPATSEGKAKIKAVLLEALEYFAEAADDMLEKNPNIKAVLEALLAG